MSNLVKKYYDVSRLVIWGEADSDDGNKRPRLILSLRDGNPRFVVYTGGTGAESIINFPTDNITMVTILNSLKEIAKAQPGTQRSFESLTTLYENDRPTKEKKVLSVLFIGKSKEGLVYFSVISEGRPKIVFTMTPSPFHVFKNADKTVVSASEISERLAIAFADLCLNAVAQLMLQYTNEEYEEGVRKSAPTVRSKGTDKAASSDSFAISEGLDDISL